MAQAGREAQPEAPKTLLFLIEKKILLTNANDQNSTCDNSPQKAWFSSKKLGSPKASCSCPKIIIPFLNTGKNSVTLCLAANKIDFGFRYSSRGTSTYNLIFGYPESAKKLVCRKIEQGFSSFFFIKFLPYLIILWRYCGTLKNHQICQKIWSKVKKILVSTCDSMYPKIIFRVPICIFSIILKLRKKVSKPSS